jgi:arginase
MKLHMTFLGAATSWGAAQRGSEQAPMALWAGGLVEALSRPHVTVDWHAVIEPLNAAPDRDMKLDEAYPALYDMTCALAREVEDIMLSQPLTVPIIIGGDHSVAVGTWSGMTNATESQGQFGLLWIDAHMDAHTPITATQGKWGGHFHGMPLAHLLGHGDKDLCEIGSKKAKLKGKYVALVGVRSFEPGEAKLLEECGATVFTAAEITERGLDAVMKDALAIVSQAPKGWGVSFDLDALDPRDMRCVGTPEKNGIRAEEFLHTLSAVKLPSRPRAIEIVEYVPEKDADGAGMKMIEKILGLLLKK